MLRCTLRQWPILLIWIRREKHIMRRERQALDLRSEAHDMGRKAARHRRLRGGGGAGLRPQEPAGQGIWIPIETRPHRRTGNGHRIQGDIGPSRHAQTL